MPQTSNSLLSPIKSMVTKATNLPLYNPLLTYTEPSAHLCEPLQLCKLLHISVTSPCTSVYSSVHLCMSLHAPLCIPLSTSMHLPISLYKSLKHPSVCLCICQYNSMHPSMYLCPTPYTPPCTLHISEHLNHLLKTRTCGHSRSIS